MTQATENLITAMTHASNRNEVADHYRLGLGWQQMGDEIDWPALNAYIIDRWSLSGLSYIKKRAWSEAARE